MSEFTDFNYGTRFAFEKADVEMLVQLLRVNDFNVSKVFYVAWHDKPFQHLPRNAAPCVLDLIVRTKKIIESVPGGYDQVWKVFSLSNIAEVTREAA